MAKKAIITGINGQDGSYLAELLLDKGYKVYGIIRRSSIESTDKTRNIEHIIDKVHLSTCSLENSLAVYKLFASIQPDECYHLAATSFVSYSLEDALSIMMNNFTATHNILLSVIEACPKCRVYFAGSSEIFGDVNVSPQNEKTSYNPRSVYGISKLSSHQLIKNYRKQYGIYACTGFTYNHESPRRGCAFVTRKITSAAASIALERASYIDLGNIDAARDWGYAPEYVRAMQLMLNAEIPKDYVIATGKLHTVRELLETAFNVVGLDYRNHIRIKKEFIRPAEEVALVGDSTEIYKDLGWKARAKFEEIIQEMVENDLRILRMEQNKA